MHGTGCEGTHGLKDKSQKEGKRRKKEEEQRRNDYLAKTCKIILSSACPAYIVACDEEPNRIKTPDLRKDTK
jgi:hypothetical protein